LRSDAGTSLCKKAYISSGRATAEGVEHVGWLQAECSIYEAIDSGERDWRPVFVHKEGMVY